MNIHAGIEDEDIINFMNDVEIKVKVEDLEGNPLSGVFISLSSSERSFRANNNTNNDGYFTFIDVSDFF